MSITKPRWSWQRGRTVNCAIKLCKLYYNIARYSIRREMRTRLWKLLRGDSAWITPGRFCSRERHNGTNVQNFIAFTRLNRVEVVGCCVRRAAKYYYYSTYVREETRYLVAEFRRNKCIATFTARTSGGDFERGNSETKKKKMSRAKKRKTDYRRTTMAKSIVKKVKKTKFKMAWRAVKKNEQPKINVQNNQNEI